MIVKLDRVDKVILRELQGNLPVVKRPFAEIAERVGVKEDEFFLRIKRLIDEDIIRKFGLRIDSKKVGYASTLIAMKVPEGKIEEIGEQISGYDFVTHNYARDHEYNLWFTIIERDKGSLKKAIESVEREVEHDDMINLPVLKRFKINVRFKIE